MDVAEIAIPSTEMAHPQEMVSPTKASVKPKTVSFPLYLPHSAEHAHGSKARLCMRVQIFPHDTTESIITTVKNFYGLYKVKGIIFEDDEGNVLIGRYENFPDNGTVHVRVAEQTPEYVDFTQRHSMSPRRLALGGNQRLLPNGSQASRSNSRTGAQRPDSPQPGGGRRSASASANKSRNRTFKDVFANSQGTFDTFYHSDSDGGNASVTSSRRAKMETLASADISVENIVEGGRRKRAKYSSFELPLYAPANMAQAPSLPPTSPQKNDTSPYFNPGHQTFSYPMQSPQKPENGEVSYTQGLVTPGPVGSASSTRAATRYAPSRQYGSSGAILPTPEMTRGSASVMSDEDVALQLMRLGDTSNISTGGRVSISTLDDAMSGKAQLSSDESDVDPTDDRDLPPLPYSAAHGSPSKILPTRAYQSDDASGDEYDDNQDASFKGESDGILPEDHHNARPRPLGSKGRSSHPPTKGEKPSKPRGQSKVKSKNSVKQPLSPASLPPGSRKASNASLHIHQLAADEEDLSSKPRCQRCRKSKKGCDRQRPCQRCKDAGIGIDGCISEDEGNGRKGRFGRHMGVPIKKPQADEFAIHEMGSGVPIFPASAAGTLEKSKKRKR